MHRNGEIICKGPRLEDRGVLGSRIQPEAPEFMDGTYATRLERILAATGKPKWKSLSTGNDHEP
jgi:hypothetical protein